jgi:hypothetical protein
MAAGGHATLVPPGDAGALAAALDTAVADMGSDQARKEATEYARAWSMDTLAERYCDVYERAIRAFHAAR